ncbi:primase-helicase family protein [Mesorhizobium sp.]|uniref:primase-helicase family protein n=1 Tax=Mesorhizobium sp. TaxID=1871066 RepID=UPI000FEAAD1B|nr:primase-helicase family protein [Mesorhizobium sp.]RWO89558.1 MAG: hypothetical protein EOQ96_05200 [Mesorhizobium sp.]
MSFQIDGDYSVTGQKALTVITLDVIEDTVAKLPYSVSDVQIKSVIDALACVGHSPIDAERVLKEINRRVPTQLISVLKREYKVATKRNRKYRPADENNLLLAYALCTSSGLVHKMLGPNPATDTMTLTTMKVLHEPEAAAFDMWLSSKDKLTFDRVRMHPALPLGIYSDASEQATVAAKYLNSYNPPAHDGPCGDCSIFFDFLTSLIPNMVERKWYLQSLAHKFQHPEVRGPAIVMVAHKTYGTGRGTLAKLLGRLFGKQYVRTVDAGTFMGTTSQSQYTDWLVGTLFVFVNELGKQHGKGSYAEKQQAYEMIKERFDPAATEMRITAKYEKAADSEIFATGAVFTNNWDAIPIPADDRRLAVITNGKQLDPQFKDRLNEAINDPAAVAAFAAFLASYDVTAFRPYDDPPMFDGKAHMIEEARSDLDRALSEALSVIDSALFTEDQILACIRKLAPRQSWRLPQFWEEVVGGLIKGQCVRIAQRGETNYRCLIDGKQQAVYARTKAIADEWRTNRHARKVAAVSSTLVAALNVDEMYKCDD